MSTTRKPNLFIIGTFKSGTTSLYRYLTASKNISGGRIKETHYLDSMVYRDLSSKSISIDEYLNYFPYNNADYIIEASPSYFYGSDELRSFLKKQIIDYKLIVLLRNPADRFLSYFYYLKSLKLIDEDLHEFYQNCVQFDDGDLSLHTGVYRNALKEGFYVDYMRNWDDELKSDKLKVYFTEDLGKHPSFVLNNIFSWLGLPNINSVSSTRENRTILVKHARLHALIVTIGNGLFTEKFKTSQFYRKLRGLYFRIIPISQKDKSEKIIYDKLLRRYSDKNKELFSYLGISDVWSQP